MIRNDIDISRRSTPGDVYRAQLGTAPPDAIHRLKAVREATKLGLYEACDVLHSVQWDIKAAIAQHTQEGR